MNIPLAKLIPWKGSKAQLMWAIQSLMPIHYNKLVDVFGGSGCVTLNLQTPRGVLRIYNDLDSNLYNMMYCVREKPVSVITELKYMQNSREEFEAMLRALKDKNFAGKNLAEELELTQISFPPAQAEEISAMLMQRAIPPDAQRAAMFFLLHNLSYNGLGTEFAALDRDWDRFQHQITRCARILQHIPMENRSYKDILSKHDALDTVFYCDPPYLGAEKYGVPFYRSDHQELHDIPNIRGGTTWGHSAVRGILSNEKYVGDVLMQKTFRQDCLSHKAIRNTGQRPMYLVQNNHEAIIDRKTYDAAQTELARRTAIKGTTEKSTPSGRSSYMPMYALSERVFCGECGTRYRRCTWVNKGKKHIVWRCVSRIDYGKKYCHTSPSVDEQQLQQAILRAINSIMSEKPALVRQVTENLQVVIHPSRSGELTIAEIEHQLESLAQEFDTAFITVASGNSTDYIERFKTILSQQTELKAKRAELERQQAENAELTSHMEKAADVMGQAGTAITEWDEYQIRALVESVRILSKEEILVRMKSGIEKIEKI